MEFELSEDQLELQRVARDVLDTEAPPELAHGLADSSASAKELWATLVDLDWPALALPESLGGLGLGWVELAILSEELGRHAAPGPFMATVTQYAALLLEVATPSEAAQMIAPIAAGVTTGTIAVDEGAGTWDPASVKATATASRQGDELTLTGTKHHVVDGATANEIATVVCLNGEVRVVVVPRSEVQAAEVKHVDAGVRHATVLLDGARVPADCLVGQGDATSGLKRALQGSVVAVAAATVGACQRIFEIVNAHAKERVQFDVPIGSFQAVKHKLVDMYRDIERARVLVYYAAMTLAEDHPDRALAASMAKAGAGEAQRRCVQDGLQLAGGIGYTREFDLHLFLRRAKVGELHFGSSSFHRRKVAKMALNKSRHHTT